MEAPPYSAEELVDEARFVHALARSLLRDADLAHDVAQDALTAALQLHSRPASWRAWLAAVTQRLAAAVRTRTRERARREAKRARPEGGDDEARTAARLALHRRLCDAVIALPEPYRTVVTLRHLDGLPPRAIARRLSRDVELVRQQVHRGLAMLRLRLDREFGDRGGWTAAFAVCGLGGAGATATLLVSVLMMKKLMLAAGVVLAVGAFWVWRGAEAAPPGAAGPSHRQLAAAPPPPAVAPPRPAASTSAEPRVLLPRAEIRFSVCVVDDEARPLRGVTVRCWRTQGEASVQQTDGAGRAEFAPSDGKGVLRIEAEARPPQLVQVEHLFGEERVVLSRGAEVSGQLLVDGTPAPAGVRLGLWMPTPELPADLPAEAVRWLRDQAWRPPCEARTQAHGGFAFRGLPDAWRGSLQLRGPYWWLPQPGMPAGSADGSSLSLQAPMRGMVLTATQLPTIRGKVVWDDTGEAVGQASIICFVGFADGDSTPTTSVAGEDDGSFAIGLYPASTSHRQRWLDPQHRPEMTRATLQASAAGSDGATKLELDGEQSKQPVVVRLQRAAMTWFQAIDERGAPVEGARVLAGGNDVSEPTGTDGRGRFTGRRDKALVGAPGFRVVRCTPRAEATGAVEDPLVFVLTPDSELRLRLRTTAGAVPPGCRLLLDSASSVFDGHAFQSELERRFGSSSADGSATIETLPDGTESVTDMHLVIDVDAHGEAVLHSLLPGLSIAVRVTDRGGAVLLRQEITTPAAGATKRIDLVVAAAMRQLRGRVFGPDGCPLAGASVLCVGDGFKLGPVATTTVADGRFACDGIYADGALRVVARKSGFVAQAIGDLLPDRDGQPLEFHLQPGQRVHVTARDAAEHVVPVRIGVDTGGVAPPPPQELAAGDVQFADLPPGPVTFHCEFGGQRFELRHDTLEADAVLRVPTPATVEVTAPPGFPDPGDGFYLTALATRLDTEAAAVEMHLSDTRADPQLLLPGRYRFSLVAQRWRDDKCERRSMGPAVEVTLRGGEEQRVQLQ